jgi:hypothetical protein
MSSVMAKNAERLARKGGRKSRTALDLFAFRITFGTEKEKMISLSGEERRRRQKNPCDKLEPTRVVYVAPYILWCLMEGREWR